MAFGGNFGNDDEMMSEINVTPLVDVMLVLLVIFILTVPVLTHTVILELPQAQSTPNRTEPDTITVSITRDGGILLNGEPLDEETFEARLPSIASQNPPPEIQIRGDRQAEYRHVVKAMAIAQRSGIKKVGLITKPD